LIPFIFWSIFGFIYYTAIRGDGLDLNFSNVFNAIVSGSYVGIFWFFPPLICIYLATPLIASIKEDRKKKVLMYIAIIGIILNIIAPFLVELTNRSLDTTLSWPYVINSANNWSFAFNIASGYIIYSIIGYLLHNYKLTKKQRCIIYIFSVVGLLVHLVGSYILSRKTGQVDMLFKKYLNIPCLLYSVGIFVFLKQLANSKKFVTAISKPTLFLQKYTFAIYLTHSFIINEFLKITGIDSDSIYSVIILFLATVPTCIIVTFLIRKIPKIGKYILP